MADIVAIEKTLFGSRMTGQSSRPDGHGLELLLGDVARAIDQQDIRLALRLADRARRLASKDPACILLYARLLIKAGLAKEALDYSEDNDDPDILLVRGTALLELGLIAEAAECCRDMLQRFSVDAVAGLSQFASRQCRAQDSKFPLGWAGIDDHLNLVGEARGTSKVHIECSDGSHSLIRFADGRDELIPFFCSLPTNVSGPLRIRADDSELLGSNLSWPPEFKPSAWVAMEGEVLLGEAQLGWSPKRRLDLKLSNSDGPAQRMIATNPDKNCLSCFSTSLLPVELAASQLDVAVVLPDGKRIRPAGSPLVFGRRSPARIESWPWSSLAPTPVIDSAVIPESAGIIDIIVPVYAGEQETLDCLRSLLRTTDRERAEVVVVNDASPEPRLCEALASLAAENRITLIAHSYNLGFAGAVNRGMKLHPDRDVILLNSDTKVFGNWLERLSNAARMSADIGTVTPLGENGSITDYSTEALANDSAEEIDRIASEANSGIVIDIPVAVGFCMYIKRKCLDRTGELDAITFGRGYGEENDFCLRARKLGWRHVAAADVFIAHQGGRSFGGDATVLRKRNGRVLNTLHPGYNKLIEDFSAADPLLEARRAIDMRRLATLASDPVLLITHDLLGGVQRHIGQRETELSAAGHTVIVLQRSDSRESTTKVSLTISSLGLGSLKFDLHKELPLLERLLRDLRLFHVELHHFLRLPPAILPLATQLTAPYDVYIHDYSWICPRITLIDGTGRYCGEPSLAGCERCIQTNGSAMEEAITVSELRDRSARLLKAARRVVVASADSRERLAKYFPDQKFETTAWESVSIHRLRTTAEAAGRVRVAIIGAIGVPKGYQVLLECARDAAARDLNLEFVVIGYTVDDQALLDTGRVFVTGPYREEEVGTLLDRESCDVAFFPSVAPETWCYSLTHAITHAFPIIAFDLGAQAERLRTYPAAELLPLSLNPQQVNFALVHWRRMVVMPFAQQKSEVDQLAANEQLEVPENASRELDSSVRVLKLPEGIYTFTVKDGSHLRDGTETLALPALQIGIAPALSSGLVEFLTGSSIVERWLAYRADMVVVRILGGDASLLLTSLQNQDSSSLEVNVERLNARPGSLAAEAKEIEPFAETASDALLVRLMAHIRYVGDLAFDAGCAGWTGQKLWIEGFAVVAIGHLPPNAIEYRGITANGLQTPWLSDRTLCGSRGGGLPLLGYAIRLRPNWSERYQCAYFGRFLSGARVGPLESGALCSSDLPGDPLEAIELHIMERQLETASIADLGATTVYGY